MAMKIVAKDFYRVFNERTKPVFSELGFKRFKANAHGWQRMHDESEVLFWPQLDKWGWNEETGSRVAFNFSISAKATAAFVIGGGSAAVQPRWCRLGNLLSSDELDAVRRVTMLSLKEIGLPTKKVCIGEHGKPIIPGCMQQHTAQRTNRSNRELTLGSGIFRPKTSCGLATLWPSAYPF